MFLVFIGPIHSNQNDGCDTFPTAPARKAPTWTWTAINSWWMLCACGSTSSRCCKTPSAYRWWIPSKRCGGMGRLSALRRGRLWRCFPSITQFLAIPDFDKNQTISCNSRSKQIKQLLAIQSRFRKKSNKYFRFQIWKNESNKFLQFQIWANQSKNPIIPVKLNQTSAGGSPSELRRGFRKPHDNSLGYGQSNHFFSKITCPKKWLMSVFLMKLRRGFRKPHDNSQVAALVGVWFVIPVFRRKNMIDFSLRFCYWDCDGFSNSILLPGLWRVFPIQFCYWDCDGFVPWNIEIGFSLFDFVTWLDCDRFFHWNFNLWLVFPCYFVGFRQAITVQVFMFTKSNSNILFNCHQFWMISLRLEWACSICPLCGMTFSGKSGPQFIEWSVSNSHQNHPRPFKDNLIWRVCSFSQHV